MVVADEEKPKKEGKGGAAGVRADVVVVAAAEAKAQNE